MRSCYEFKDLIKRVSDDSSLRDSINYDKDTELNNLRYGIKPQPAMNLELNEEAIVSDEDS